MTTGTSFMGLAAFQWVGLVLASLTLLILADVFAGHYRSGFVFRSQYAPLISGILLVATTLAAVLKPDAIKANVALQMAGWLAIVFGLIGFGFHHYYGIAKKPAGYKWLLHYLMYGAPPLAPLALAIVGALALITAKGLANQSDIGGVSLRTALLISIALAISGATLQATILHYRGAFNNPFMFAPLTVPVLAIVMAVWTIISSNAVIVSLFSILLWLTFVIGFIGLGMHLRGFGRQMGGLYVAAFNWLEGPPAFAPALFTGFAAVGLIVVYLL